MRFGCERRSKASFLAPSFLAQVETAVRIYIDIGYELWGSFTVYDLFVLTVLAMVVGLLAYGLYHNWPGRVEDDKDGSTPMGEQATERVAPGANPAEGTVASPQRDEGGSTSSSRVNETIF